MYIRIKPVLIALAVILIGGAIIFLTYLFYLSKIPSTETLQVPKWKYNYGLRIKEIKTDELIVSGFIGRDLPEITLTAQILPYTSIYKLYDEPKKIILSSNQNPEILEDPANYLTKRQPIELTDLKISQKINIFTPDEAADGNTIRVVKIETR